MTDTSPLHVATWVKPLSRYMRKNGFNDRSLLKRSGIDQREITEEDSRLPFNRIAEFFELAAEEAGDDRLGFHFGQTQEARDAGMIGYVGQASSTILDSLLNLRRYRRIFSDAAEAGVERLREEGILSWNFRVPASITMRQFQEFSTTNLVNTMRRMTGRDFVLERIVFPHPRAGDTREYVQFFGGPVEFGQGRSELHFKLRDLDLIVRTADDRLLAILKEHCQSVLKKREPEQTSLVQEVERLVVERLTADRAKLDIVAAELGMSGRTLARRLKAENTTFNIIVDGLRRELAMRYLKESDLGLSQIANLLGYAEVSSFDHAFKRWTGATPNVVRRLAR